MRHAAQAGLSIGRVTLTVTTPSGGCPCRSRWTSPSRRPGFVSRIAHQCGRDRLRAHNIGGARIRRIGIGAVNSADADAVRLPPAWGPQRRHGHRVHRGRRRRDGGVHEPRWPGAPGPPRSRRGAAIQAPRLALFERRQNQRQRDRRWTRHGSGADLRKRHRRPARRQFPLDLLAAGGEGDAHRISSSGGHDRQRVFQSGSLSARDVSRRDRRPQPRDSRRRHPQRRRPQLRRRDRLSGLRSPLRRRRHFRLDVRSGCELRSIRDRWELRRPRQPIASLTATAVQDGDDAAAAFNVGGLFDVASVLKGRRVVPPGTVISIQSARSAAR